MYDESHGMGLFLRYCVHLPLGMTKDELLVLLGSLDSIEAGAAASFVESLDSKDPRFQRPFLGSKPLSTLGYWLEQKKLASGSGFQPSKYPCKPACIEQSMVDHDSCMVALYSMEFHLDIVTPTGTGGGGGVSAGEFFCESVTASEII